jgi:hypothetical protein
LDQRSCSLLLKPADVSQQAMWSVATFLFNCGISFQFMSGQLLRLTMTRWWKKTFKHMLARFGWAIYLPLFSSLWYHQQKLCVIYAPCSYSPLQFFGLQYALCSQTKDIWVGHEPWSATVYCMLTGNILLQSNKPHLGGPWTQQDFLCLKHPLQGGLAGPLLVGRSE